MTLDDQLLLAPITKSPKHVLDMGTGTGIWAIEFGKTQNKCRFRFIVDSLKAREYPSASVIGIDLSPIPPPL